MSSTSKVPKLPPTDDGEVNSIRYEVNPAIALSALTDIYQRVQQYQIQLRQLVQKIHRIYVEGPVVSGWLASEASLDAAVKCSSHPDRTVGNIGHQSQLEPIDLALFRHGDADELMDYLSALESAMLENAGTSHGCLPPKSPLSEDEALPSSKYYLCRLTSSGQIEAEQCPPDQVPVLSMAIARYQRLTQLVQQKQAIETKLQAVVDILGDAQTILTD